MSDGFDPLFREVNLRIHELTRGFWEPAEYLCECGDATCQGTMIALHASVFADLIALQDVALVMPGHEAPGAEIVRRGRGYVVVRETADSWATPAPQLGETSPARPSFAGAPQADECRPRSPVIRPAAPRPR